MIRVAIVEDEKSASDKLSEYIERYSVEKNIQTSVVKFGNAVDFLSEYNSIFDVVFMDIEMPMMNGMDAAHQLRNVDKSVCLIFITNMTQYAVKGYEVDAIGYIVKPIDYFAFSVYFDKAIRHTSNKHSAEIIVKTDEYVKRFFVNDLYYIEVSGHYVVYHTTSGNYRELGQINKLEAILPKGDFFRCHNCFLVNLKYATEIRKNFVKVGNDEVEISRRRRKEFLLALNDYFGRKNT